MGKSIIRLLLIVFFTYISSEVVIAQSKKELEEKKRQTEKEIENANNLLKTTKEKRKSGFNELLVINRKVKIQEELINTINHEINFLNKNIKTLQDTIIMLERDLDKMREEYAIIVKKAFRKRDDSNIFLYIMSAEDFSQAYKRLKYIQQYENYREKKVNEIIEKNNEITYKLEELSITQAEKRVLLQSNIEVEINLKTDKNQKSMLISSLKSKERKLINDINDKKLLAKKIQNEIQRIIEEEIRKAEELARKNKEGNVLLTLTPEEKLVSDNFEENKSRLPWPTERGIITSEFGIQNHPVLKGITINNNGIDISTTEGSYARAIFNGTVTAISYLDGINNVVLIKHGNYYSVYANLVDVIVKVNDQVTEKQLLGKIYTNNKEGSKTFINFQIWKGINKLDPIDWIAN